jgi:hypothetical protein
MPSTNEGDRKGSGTMKANSALQRLKKSSCDSDLNDPVDIITQRPQKVCSRKMFQNLGYFF